MLTDSNIKTIALNGNCSIPGTATVKISGAITTSVDCQADNTWKAVVDLSATMPGNSATLTITEYDQFNNVSAPVTLTIPRTSGSIWTVEDGIPAAMASAQTAGIAQDGMGNSFVIGSAYGSGSQLDGQTIGVNGLWFLTKYDSNHVLQWTIPLPEIWTFTPTGKPGLVVDRGGNPTISYS